ncbi:class I SAM-dependent methyltransferase, partial [Streptomyces sp. SID14478]|uniref:SAM-dependent methyltransferase n=1 Tax=Streptomyces sp. SID14478 TaxID=2706073 RepID=UPI0013E05ABB
VLDLGCGTAEWLLRALSAHPEARAEGVDIDQRSLEQARRAARERGVDERLALHHSPAADFAPGHGFDVVLCVGSTHAFGGLLPTLEGAHARLAPGGRVLIGDGYWQSAPTPEAVEMLGDLTDLAGTVDRVAAAGWTPVYAHCSTRHELDDYEWTLWGALSEWALEHPGHPDAAEASALAAQRRTEWLRGYRDSFGFVCLVLRRTDGS